MIISQGKRGGKIISMILMKLLMTMATTMIMIIATIKLTEILELEQ